jgi:hypothetical protein
MPQVETSIDYPQTGPEIAAGLAGLEERRSPKHRARLAQANENGELENAIKTVKRCRSCWRDDIHYNVSIPPFLLGMLLVVTLGGAMFFKPSRCVCCGTMRLR